VSEAVRARASEREQQRARGTGKALVVVGADGQVLCDVCRLADTPLGRLRGLLGTKELRRGEGILLHPASAVHTAFLRFPIDVVFVDPELTVVAVVAGLRPWRTARARGARTVLELAAGEAARRGIRVGDRIGWARI
jgi:uncharacterized membrane protein (UPF0127 family)